MNRLGLPIHGFQSYRWLSLLVVIVIGVVLVFLLRPNDEFLETEVVKGDIVHSFVALGRVESETTVEIAPKFTGRILEITVEEGDSVDVGQVVARMDDSIVRADFQRAQQAAKAAEARWQETRRGPRPEAIDQAKHDQAALQGDLDRMQAKLAEVLRGPRREKIDKAEAQVSLSQAEADYAHKQLEREITLANRDATSQASLDQLRRSHEVALAQLAADRAQLQLLRNGATDEEKQQARAAVAAAKARYAQAQAVLQELVHGATEEELRFAKAEFNKAKAEAQRLSSTLAESVLKSPLKGVVLRRYKEPGDLAYPQQLLPKPILVLADSDQRLIRIEVVEYDLYKLRLGQRATIESDSYSGQRWSGEVTRIAPVMGKKSLASENPKEKTDVRILEAWITPDEEFRLPFNVPVEAKVIEPVRTNVLIIPIRAVDEAGRVQLDNGQHRTIKLGARDDAMVEVLEGLQEHDRIRVPR